MGTNNHISRSAFLKRSTLGLGALFAGVNVKAGTSNAGAIEGKEPFSLQWNSSFHPDRPSRLSAITHRLAEIGLSGEHGRALVQVSDWPFPEWESESLSGSMKYAAGAMRIAQNAPLRILQGELIVGSATVAEATWHMIPLLKIPSVSHTTLGFNKVLHTGYKGIRNEINERLNRGGLDEHGVDLLHSMLKTLDAAKVWQERNIALLKEMKAKVPRKERAFYQTIIDTLQHVPENEPRSFREAVQSLWSMYAFLRLMGNWSGIGRMDQMLWPYLEKDLNKGVLTLDDAREIIAHFWIKGTEWIGVPNSTGDAQFYQNVILGGIDKNGNEVTNPVTYLILDVVEELHISDFPIAVRIGEKTPEKLYRRVAELQRYGGGIVAVYNEDVAIESMVKFGYPLEEAREFTNDGCWEILVPGKTSFIYTPSDMMPALFRALHLDSAEPLAYADFDSLYAAFVEELKRDINRVQDNMNNHSKDAFNTTPLVSMFVEGCIEKGLGYNERGPEYTVNGVHYGGVTDTANSLLVLKNLVFNEGYLSLNDFADILRANWEGHEGLRRLIGKRFEFYGNDNAESDAMMVKVFNDYTEIVGQIKEREGVRRPCGISTFGREIDWRMMRKATPQGSRVGDMLATNCSPTPGTDLKGPTAVLNSYCKMDFTRCSCGATVELKVLPDSVKGENGIAALVALSKTFRQQKGFYMHIDVVDTAKLIDAQMHPEKYPNLPVRVAGWSARFTTLCKQWQDMVIQRTQQVV